ncbi:hypothetical protein KEM54_004473 [Ascosphaera aggregata]|nr:hypothetical protein KEM54_004473 [Ascosphaera aggregata]
MSVLPKTTMRTLSSLSRNLWKGSRPSVAITSQSPSYKNYSSRPTARPSPSRSPSPLSLLRAATDVQAPRNWTPTPFVTETVERIICLNGQVDETLSASIVAQLLFLEADNPEKPISLYINSPGGSVTAGLAIYDTMTYITSPVSTICIGQAASMGSLLLCGGASGKRYCLPHSSIMVHQPSGGYFGQASDIAIHAKEILRVREQLNGIYQRHLTREMSMEEIEKLMERDYFMGAQEAREMGIVDEILERREDAVPEKK